MNKNKQRPWRKELPSFRKRDLLSEAEDSEKIEVIHGAKRVRLALLMRAIDMFEKSHVYIDDADWRAALKRGWAP